MKGFLPEGRRDNMCTGKGMGSPSTPEEQGIHPACGIKWVGRKEEGWTMGCFLVS
jgi:hypothetical protein